MSVRRIAVFSMHTSPLAQPGTGDGGGMNVYVRALASALARAGVECDVYTRAEHRTQPSVVQVEPGFRVVHVEAGPRAPVPKHDLPALVDPFVDASMRRMLEREPVDVLHGNYWLSGAVAHRIKHELDLPLVATFHTLARVKAEAGSRRRFRAPHARRAPSHRVRRSDARVHQRRARAARVAVRRRARSHRGRAAGRRPHRVLPGDRGAARQRLGIDAPRVLLFVGRIQELKGADLAIRALAALDDPKVALVIVGGPSGRDGHAEQARVHALADELGVSGQIHWVSPRRHERLADYYRAADVCIVPSRSESFGLVALEAAACGTPVVAAAVGGLRSLVQHEQSGFLIEGRDPVDFAAPVERLLADEILASDMGVNASARSKRYSWSMTAGRLRRLYGDLVARGLVRCD